MYADMYINADVVNASFEIMKIFLSFFSESFNGVIIVNKIDFRSTSLCYGHWRPSHILKGHLPISLRPLTLVSIFIAITQTTSIKKKSWLKIKLLQCALSFQISVRKQLLMIILISHLGVVIRDVFWVARVLAFDDFITFFSLNYHNRCLFLRFFLQCREITIKVYESHHTWNETRRKIKIIIILY